VIFLARACWRISRRASARRAPWRREHVAHSEGRDDPSSPRPARLFRSLHRAHAGAQHRIEEDLVDQLFNSSEKRLARALLLLARYGKEDMTSRTLPKLSQETLAEMVGTTRSRVNFFMNKFRKLGFIEYNGGLKIHNSLISIVLHD
jgi:hypothetical protein